MKILFFSSVVMATVMCTATVQAQQEVTEINVNGFKVIFKPSPKQTVSAIMFYKGGTANYNEDQQGIESLTMSALAECGTEQYPKDAFKDKADKFGINISGTATYDFATLGMSCVKPYFNEGWDLFVQAILKPSFEANEVALLQQKLISGLKNEEGDPDTKLSLMAKSNTFKGTRYAYLPQGVPASIQKFSANDLRTYYNQKLLNANRMVLVVTGNMNVEDLKKKVINAFGTLPATAISDLPVAETNRIADNNLNTENRKLATNYIMGVMGAPDASSASSVAFRLSMNILSDRLFEEVRTKRNLSYAPQAFYSGGLKPYSGIYVTTTKPKEAVTVMADEVKRLRNGGFTESQLRDAKSEYATSYYMKNESTYSISYSLGSAEMKGSWKKEEMLLEHVNAVTLKDMQQVFKEYTKGIAWNYLGDTTLADKESFAKKVYDDTQDQVKKDVRSSKVKNDKK